VATWREGRAGGSLRGVAGDAPTPGRQPAAPYGRKPTGRGAAAGWLPPLPAGGQSLRNAPTMTAPARTGRAVLLAPGAPIAVEAVTVTGRDAAHRPGRPLQRQGHPKILSNRFAERIFGTHP